MQVQRQYALKQIFMKIEFENSIRRLSILFRITDIKITWINPWFDRVPNTWSTFAVKIQDLDRQLYQITTHGCFSGTLMKFFSAVILYKTSVSCSRLRSKFTVEI